MRAWRSAVAGVLGSPVAGVAPLAGGCVGTVLRVTLADGRDVVAKLEPPEAGTLPVEASMLRALAATGAVPVPDVLHGEPGLLLMRFVAADGRGGTAAQRHAAELLAALHAHTRECFGYDHDTVIGGLHQDNSDRTSWIEFFAEQRLVAMAAQATAAGRLPAAMRGRVERLAGRLGGLLVEPAAPALLHGDVWSGNVLVDGGRVAAFLDPAIHYGHPETELAFIRLFGTFGEPFFDAYRALAPLAPGFDERVDLHNLYPLLVHVRLFGGGYVAGVDRILRRHGV